LWDPKALKAFADPSQDRRRRIKVPLPRGREEEGTLELALLV
jgi:hypothetical protein